MSGAARRAKWVAWVSCSVTPRASGLSEYQQESLRKLRIPFELEKVDKLAALSKAKIVFRALARDVDAAEKR